MIPVHFSWSSTRERKGIRWLRLAGIVLLVLAAIADLRTFIVAHGTPHNGGTNEGVATESVSLTILLFQWGRSGTVCKRMERMVREVTAHMPSVEVKTVNLAEPANRHYIMEFGLETEAVVLHDGARFVVLDTCRPSDFNEAVFKDCIDGIIADLDPLRK